MNQGEVDCSSNSDAVSTGIAKNLATSDISTNADGISTFTTSKGGSRSVTRGRN